MQKVAEKYGDITSFYLGSRLLIVLNSYPMMKEMLVDYNFAADPRLRHHLHGSLRTLRDFGFAGAQTVEMVDDQLDSIFQTLDEAATSVTPMEVLGTFILASNSIITEMTLGHRFERNDPEFLKVNALMKKLPDDGITESASVSFPIIDRFGELFGLSSSVVQNLEYLHSFIRKGIQQREKIMVDESTEPECLYDVYIQEKRKAEKAGDFETFKDFQLIRVCFEFFLAGTDTTARSMEWLLLYMAFYPEVQDRVQNELDSVIGQSRRPRMQDRTELHYTSAVIDETYRKASLVACGLFHRAVEETHFHGYRIPSDAVILPLVYGVHHRAEYWERPNEFYPEHFLDDEGRYRSSPYLIPFLIGRRSCVGESLARMEIVLFFTAIMQRYRVRPELESAARRRTTFRLEMLDDQTFAGRPQMSFMRRVTRDCGILIKEGEQWSRHRRLSLKSLRDSGFARLKTIDMIDDQLDIIFECFDRFSSSCAGAKVVNSFLLASNSVITEMTLGKRFDRNDPHFQKVNSNINDLIQLRLFQSAPFLYKAVELLVSVLPMTDARIVKADFVHNFIQEEVRKRQKIMETEGAQPRCLCDTYLLEKRKAEKAGDFETCQKDESKTQLQMEGVIEMLPKSLASLLGDNFYTVAAPAAAGLAAAYMLYSWRQGRDLPPGPVGLPVLGRLPWISRNQMHRSMMKICQQYGDISSFYLGSRLVIVVNSYPLMKEMLDSQMFSGRPQLRLFKKLTRGCGIIFTEGDVWNQQRRLSLRTLRDFGFARKRTVEMVDEQLDSMFNGFDEIAALYEPVQLLETFLLASNAIVAEMTLGQKFEADDPAMKLVNAIVKKLIEDGIIQGVEFLFPAMERLADLVPASSSLRHRAPARHDSGQIRKREAVMKDESVEPQCLCDAYIKEKRQAEKAGDFETFKEHQIIRVTMEFFLAGTDTTARSMEWLLLYMAFYPEVQDRVQNELDSVVGQSRRPRMQDRTELHYTSAVIDETYRKASLVGTGVFHRSVEDATFHGYRIPSDAIIIPLVYGVHHRAEYWERPNEFYPEHFLDDEGRYRSSPYLIPFLIGRRSCVGESLARMEIFLFFTAIMQRYRVRPEPEFAARKEEILAGSIGAFVFPGDYQVTMDRR
uniref:Cytochrome P450 n=1 Tax=Macrostomum lignano TaxID=282301 RepID=A0A1I8HYQ3_9PLAT